MVRYNNLSILRTVDLSSTSAVQEVIQALRYHFPPNPPQTQPRTPPPVLRPLHQTTVDRIVTAVNRNPNYPLLRQIIDRFIDPKRYKVDKWNGGTLKEKTEEAVRELESLIEEQVFTCPEYRWKQYYEAEARFDKLVEGERLRQIPLRYVYLRGLGFGFGLSFAVAVIAYCTFGISG